MVASFVGFTGFTLVMPFLALHSQALGVTDVGTVAEWTGVTLGVTPLVAALCAPLWGRVGDRFGNKILLQRSLSSFVLVMGLMAVRDQAWQLLALRALQGLVAGHGASAIAMAARSAPREKMANGNWLGADGAARGRRPSAPSSVGCCRRLSACAIRSSSPRWSTRWRSCCSRISTGIRPTPR